VECRQEKDKVVIRWEEGDSRQEKQTGDGGRRKKEGEGRREKDGEGSK